MVAFPIEEDICMAQTVIIGQLAEGVIVTDPSGRITFVNDAAAAIHGVARLDVDPDAYSDTYHLFTEDRQPYPPRELPLARAVRGETVRDARWRIVRPDGTEVLAIGSAQPLLAPSGRRIGAVLTLRDDTAREAAERSLRESESALKELNATLAARVGERTRAAREAQAEAEAASRAKSDFLATMSHEIRTPLSSVLGHADLLLDTPGLAEGVRGNVERIRSAGSALLTIVNDILDFSKVEAGQVDLVHASFSPFDLAEDAVGLVAIIASRKGLALRLDADANLPPHLTGDRERLRQILLNLLNNALKFTPEGEVALRVRLLAVSQRGVRLRFEVRDTGIGIARDKQPLLFQSFRQVDGSIQRQYGGTGLGLAIAKRLVELMGGTIGCESEAGRGALFWFELGLPFAERPAPLAAEPSRPFPSRRLLLVEDIETNRRLAQVILEKGGHVVDVACSGEEAVRAVQAKDYDLVLMDVQMPGIDGLTATRLIRSLRGDVAAVPVLAMTAAVLPHQVAAFHAAGMQDHICKPFKRDVLFSTIDRWARGARPASAPTATEAAEPGDPGALLDVLSKEKIDRLLACFAEELSVRFGADGTTPDQQSFAADAHALGPAAGALGFRDLTDACRDATRPIGEGGHATLVDRVHRLRRQTLTAIAAQMRG